MFVFLPVELPRANYLPPYHWSLTSCVCSIVTPFFSLQPGDYSISMKGPNKIKHFNVKNLPDGRYGIGQRKFDSMDELIEHYRKAPIYTSTEEGRIYLSSAFPKR